VVIADVGGAATYHVGDEAMLAANLAAFRRRLRGVRFTVVSCDPEETAANYGVDAIAPIGFPAAAEGSDAERQRLLDQVLRLTARRAVGGVSLGEPAGGVAFNALAAATGLVVSGGGNLHDTWPEHVYERVALLRIAQALGRPSVLLGQGIGPELGEAHRELLAGSLPHARLVSVRDPHSLALAASLGVDRDRLLLQRDDALFLEGEPPAEPWLRDWAEEQAPPWIGLTIHPFVHPSRDDGSLARLAELLAQLAHATGARLLFLPHVASPDETKTPSDAAVGRHLAEQMPPGVELAVAPVLPAVQVAWLTRRAALVLSTRYHPVVFATSAGVPSIALYADAYTRVKLRAALWFAGLDGWSLPLRERGLSEELVALSLQAWREREFFRRTLLRRLPAWREDDELRIARACAVLRTRKHGDTPAGAAPSSGSGGLASRFRWSRNRREGNPSAAEIRDLVASVPYWHHIFAFLHGITTLGACDPRDLLSRLRLPELGGRRVLDVGTRDGFFAFECERRGAQVVALDDVEPEKTGFAAARRILGSQVEYVRASVYDLTPEEFGHFDLVFFHGILFQLCHPLLALDRLRQVTKDLLIVESPVCNSSFFVSYLEARSLASDLPELACLKALLEDARFTPTSAEVWGDQALVHARVVENRGLTVPQV
jgi:polysaccharide pyruvyl transferase WcaK-like protein/SAM-dependent methyltransferase